MDITIWSLLTLLSKITLYLAVAGSIGGWFCLILLRRHQRSLDTILRYIRCSAALGCVSAFSGFFIQSGAIADQGFSGLFDTNTLYLLIQSSVGDATTNRVFGFGFIALASHGLKITLRQNFLKFIFRYASSLLGIIWLLCSFSQLGHLAETNFAGHLAINFHVLAMAIWVGSLYPLWFISRGDNLKNIQESMRLFGRIAVFIVGVLLVCGLYMAYLLVGDISHLFSSTYGRGLLVKLILVAVLLLIAANNKWRWAPSIQQPENRLRLTKSIVVEIGLAFAILIVTAVISTLVAVE